MSQSLFQVELPDKPAGRPTNSYYEQVEAFAASLRRFDEQTTDIIGSSGGLSARGYAYLLEGEGHISKGEIDYAEKLINKCRKNDFGKSAPFDHALLPTDFTARDDARQWYCKPNRSNIGTGPEEYLLNRVSSLINASGYNRSFWEYQDVFIQVLVEKIDLVTLFKPICREYNIPITTGKGWSTINQRADILSRCYFWEQQNGNQPVILYCGDFDPPGKLISETLKKNMQDLGDALVPVNDGYATGWDEYQVHVDRFGLNADFVFEHDLPWIDNLETGSGKNLASPSHDHYDRDYVQNWLDQYGPRKVEANALISRPEAGKQLFRQTVQRYLGEEPKREYEDDLDRDKRQIKNMLRQIGVLEGLQGFVEESR